MLDPTSSSQMISNVAFPHETTEQPATSDSLTNNLKKGKQVKKRLFGTTPLSPPHTRSHAKRTQEDASTPSEEDDGGSHKKKKIFVPGTLGHGETAVHIKTPPLTKGSFKPSRVAQAPDPQSANFPTALPHAEIKTTFLDSSVPQNPIISVPRPINPGSLASPIAADQMPAAVEKNTYMMELNEDQYNLLQRLLQQSTAANPVAVQQSQGQFGSQVLASTSPPACSSLVQSPKTTPAIVAPPSTPAKPPRAFSSPSKPFNNSSSKTNQTPPTPQGNRKPGSSLIAPTSKPGRMTPVACQVTDPDIQDPILAPQYQFLSNLSQCTVTSLSGEIPREFFSFSGWAAGIPEMDESSPMSAITFEALGRNINLSRCNPTLLRYKETKNGPKERRDIVINEELALCFTTVFVRRSNIQTLTPAGQKSILGVPHCQEFERMAAVLGMTLDLDEIRMSFYQSGLSFNTYGRSLTSSSNFSGRRSALVSGPGRAKLSTLNYTDPVYVFDARDWEFNLLDLLSRIEVDDSTPLEQKMHQLGFELYDGEIPPGSCVVVAHTTNASREEGRYSTFTINFNIQFAILLGSPLENQGQDTFGTTE